jgi:hypothetical protein
MADQENPDDKTTHLVDRLPEDRPKARTLGRVGRARWFRAVFMLTPSLLSAVSCSDGGASVPPETTAINSALLSGTDIAWVNTVLNLNVCLINGPCSKGNLRTGDLALNTGPALGANMAIAQGANAPGDGGGGVFYWVTSSSQNDDGGTFIVPNSSGQGTVGASGSKGGWRRAVSGCLDAGWFGATGTSDDSAQLQWAINALQSGTGAHCLTIPPGAHYVDSTLTVTNGNDLTIQGSGRNASALVPSQRFPDNSPKGAVISFVDAFHCGLRDLAIRGNPLNCTSGVPPLFAGVQSIIDGNAGASANFPTDLDVREVTIGPDSSCGSADSAFQYGIVFAPSSSTTDAMNDQSTIENAVITGFTIAGISIEGGNSLLHRIVGGRLYSNAPQSAGVATAGGSFALWGTDVEVGLTDFYVHAPAANTYGGTSTAAYFHSIEISNVQSESPTAAMLYTDAPWPVANGNPPGVNVNIVGYDKNGPQGSCGSLSACPRFINFQAQGTLTLADSRIDLGIPADLYFAGSQLTLHGNYLNYVRWLQWTGNLTSFGNTWAGSMPQVEAVLNGNGQSLAQTVAKGGDVLATGLLCTGGVYCSGYLTPLASMSSQPFTPNGSSDPQGNQGDMAWDTDYLYLRLAEHWVRSPWQTF